jgi:hypothetical protein
LDGEITEQIFNSKKTRISTKTIKNGNVSFIDNTIGSHSIMNETENISTSLHIYPPTISFYYEHVFESTG